MTGAERARSNDAINYGDISRTIGSIARNMPTANQVIRRGGEFLGAMGLAGQLRDMVD